MECVICCDEKRDSFVQLDCFCENIWYHKRCIKKWFIGKNTLECPYCTCEATVYIYENGVSENVSLIRERDHSRIAKTCIRLFLFIFLLSIIGGACGYIIIVGASMQHFNITLYAA